MEQELQSYWEMFFQESVHFLKRGDHLPKDLVEKLPLIWVSSLSLEMNVGDSIRKIWRISASQHSANFVNLLADHVSNLGLIISIKKSTPIGLAYIFQHQQSGDLCSWIGGLPITQDALFQTQAQLGFHIPASYYELLTVHNGLTRDGWISLGPRPLHKLRYISDYQGKQLRTSPRLMAFSGDGAGNEQCYDLNAPVGEYDFLTVNWDHETQVVGSPVSFSNYLYLLGVREMGVKTI